MLMMDDTIGYSSGEEFDTPRTILQSTVVDETNTVGNTTSQWRIVFSTGMPDVDITAIESATTNTATATAPAAPPPTTTPVHPPIPLTSNKINRTYLITYSQADLSICPTRESFATLVVEAFQGNVNYMCVSRECHSGVGMHYHAAVLLSTSSRWHPAKTYMQSRGVVVNFSTSGAMYAGAYFYVTKDDPCYIHAAVKSQSHPPRSEIGTNEKAKKANTTYLANVAKRKAEKENARGAESESAKKKSRPKLTRLKMIDLCLENNIKTDDEMLVFAKKRRSEMGDDHVLENFTRIGEKGRGEVLREAAKMSAADENVRLSRTSRMEIVKSVLSSGECSCKEKGMWLTLAYDICDKNRIDAETIKTAFYELLVGGRKKHKNIILVGESNCAKTFLVQPLSIVFTRTFNTPPSSTFGWLDADTAQIILLNDYRWKPTDHGGDIAWDAFLRLLEGGDCKLPAPMNSRASHISLPRENDVPIFCTSGDTVKFWKKDLNEPQTDEHRRENKMMDERWRVIRLQHVFDEDDKVECPPCAWCFCVFVDKST